MKLLIWVKVPYSVVTHCDPLHSCGQQAQKVESQSVHCVMSVSVM